MHSLAQNFFALGVATAETHAMPEEHPQMWLSDIVAAFRALEEEPGEIVWLQNVYDWIRQHRKQRPKNFADVIRATIYHHSSDSEAYVPGNPNVFRRIAHGGWALRHPKEATPSRSTDLWSFLISRMTVEEISALAGPLFAQELDRRAEEIRQRFDMT